MLPLKKDELDEALDAAELTARRLEADMVRRFARIDNLTSLTGYCPDEEFIDQLEAILKAWEKEKK